jgi:lipopolysaccharide/colanic/teichoic acid biosynthesis glycosyltransferase
MSIGEGIGVWGYAAPGSAAAAARTAREATAHEADWRCLGRSALTAKRILDVLVSLAVLLLALPLLLLAMVAPWLETPGSPLFLQERVGRDGRSFRIVKLRTMFADNDDSDHQAYVAAMIRGIADRHHGMFKLVDDPRITRVGRVLRRFSIDELPQAWNVLRGDMSLVGPRPALPREVEMYSATASRRLRVKPGITGLWQVSGRSALSFEEMVELDVSYWETWTPLLELSILVRTPWVVLTGGGAA